MDDCIELHLDNIPNHQADIQRFVWDRICIRDYILVDKICKKAQHVFLWTVLAVRTLKKAYDEGKSLQDMLNSLEDLPSDMHAIFQALLKPPLNSQTRLMLQLVLYVCHPLTPRALYGLIMVGTEQEQLESWQNKSMTEDRIRAFITTSSKGLLEVYSGSDDGLVQFIHESVRDYLLDKKAMVAAELNTIVPIAGICHINIAKCCLAGMSDDTLHLDVAKDPTYKTPHHLQYAINNVLEHICDIADLAVVENLLRTYARSFKSWGRFTPIADEADTQYSGSALVRIVISSLAYCRQPNRARILSLVINNSAIMQLNPITDLEEFYRISLEAAIDYNWIEGVKIVLQAGAQLEKPALLDETILCGDFLLTKALLMTGANPNVYSHEHEDSFLCLAIDTDLDTDEMERMVVLLLDYGADPNAIYERKGDDEALTRAVEHQYFGVISALIFEGAEVSDRALDLARRRVRFKRAESEGKFSGEGNPTCWTEDLWNAEKILWLLEENCEPKGHSLEEYDRRSIFNERKRHRQIELLKQFPLGMSASV
ncbi:MAG: hypothetical protein GOMPHAMPRED_005812 [Gomphillus americanus]|uniref:Uncharacterized protein n=1 Tax=Gomphillus americanus TaxID=1940652 RepID=A0A8H3FRU7_9LECA|nr:MAG: hypothetical protein GOMPHAMPRED_005812 [Gomphillus americanus]